MNKIWNEFSPVSLLPFLEDIVLWHEMTGQGVKSKAQDKANKQEGGRFGPEILNDQVVERELNQNVDDFEIG